MIRLLFLLFIPYFYSVLYFHRQGREHLSKLFLPRAERRTFLEHPFERFHSVSSRIARKDGRSKNPIFLTSHRLVYIYIYIIYVHIFMYISYVCTRGTLAYLFSLPPDTSLSYRSSRVSIFWLDCTCLRSRRFSREEPTKKPERNHLVSLRSIVPLIYIYIHHIIRSPCPRGCSSTDLGASHARKRGGKKGDEGWKRAWKNI